MADAETYMRRCFSLAQLGAGWVSPNPIVGAVVVHNDRIIGEGWHAAYGGPHAEVNAINSVQNKALLKEATLYCSLEPCHHYGKTPPCVDLIIKCQFKKVVISNLDPNPLVGGKSIEKMREAGIEVTTGVLEATGAWLNRYFFHWITQKTPYVVLKWAQSKDGRIAKMGEQTPISSAVTRRLVHRWRSELDGILVGTHTALIDNPQLDTRFFPSGRLTRIALDSKGRLPSNYHLLDDSRETLIIGPPKKGTWKNTKFVSLNRTDSISSLLLALKEQGIATLLVEGGAQLHRSFLEADAWQEIRIIESTKVISEGVAAPILPSKLVRQQEYCVGDDQIRWFSKLAIPEVSR
jgi:diaminohydroxyphosphoribosylaminopyrimidine deaminase/5-amino-6-(5-phosphoribosylamino)uracil reductase